MRLTLLLALLAVLAGWLIRKRIRAARENEREVTDAVVRQIERQGRLEYDPHEPIDLDEIRKEEDAFWAQTWDEPEPL